MSLRVCKFHPGHFCAIGGAHALSILRIPPANIVHSAPTKFGCDICVCGSHSRLVVDSSIHVFQPHGGDVKRYILKSRHSYSSNSNLKATSSQDSRMKFLFLLASGRPSSPAKMPSLKSLSSSIPYVRLITQPIRTRNQKS